MMKALSWVALGMLAVACASPSGSDTDPEDREKEEARKERKERRERQRHDPVQLPRRTPGSY